MSVLNELDVLSRKSSMKLRLRIIADRSSSLETWNDSCQTCMSIGLFGRRYACTYDDKMCERLKAGSKTYLYGGSNGNRDW